MDQALFAGVIILFLLVIGLMCWASNYFDYAWDRIAQLEAKIDHLEWYIQNNAFSPTYPRNPPKVSKPKESEARRIN